MRFAQLKIFSLKPALHYVNLVAIALLRSHQLYLLRTVPRSRIMHGSMWWIPANFLGDEPRSDLSKITLAFPSPLVALVSLRTLFDLDNKKDIWLDCTSPRVKTRGIGPA